MKMETGKRRITISKNGISEPAAVTSNQVRPSSRAPRKEGTANFSHFRGADNPEWRNSCYSNSKNAPPDATADGDLFKLNDNFSPAPPPPLLHHQSDSASHKIKHHVDVATFSDDLRRRLQDIDVVADSMAKKVQGMKKEMHTRKEMDDLNDDFNGPNRLRIISQAKREMRKNKRILIENRELRHSLAEHQTVLEMVMNKFRRVSAHAANLEREQTISDSKNGVVELKKENQKLAERVGEMLSLMSCAITQDNRQTQNWMYVNTKIKQLQKENGGLRELLHLSKRNGSIKMTFDAENRTSSEESQVHDTTSSDENTVINNLTDEDELSISDVDVITEVIKNEFMLNTDSDDEDDDSSSVETSSISSCSTVVNADLIEPDSLEELI